MSKPFGALSTLRRRLAAAISPEMVALGLVVALAVLILSIVWLGSS